jgi:hypothetical protein
MEVVMKIWQSVVIVLLLVSLPLFSSCQLLGIGGKSKEQLYYEQQLQLLQAQQEAAQKANDEYYQQLQDSLNQYLQQYNAYQQAQQQQQMQAVIDQATAAQETPIPYN